MRENLRAQRERKRRQESKGREAEAEREIDDLRMEQVRLEDEAEDRKEAARKLGVGQGVDLVEALSPGNETLSAEIVAMGWLEGVQRRRY